MNNNIKKQFTEIDKQIEQFKDELKKVWELYYDPKSRRWKKGFFVSDWNYYTDFLAKADYEDWEDKDVCSYINYLGRRIHNLVNKKNQIVWKNFGK